MKHTWQSRTKRREKSEISPPEASPLCPGCGSNRANLNGYTSNLKQRYICKSCRRTFISPKVRESNLNELSSHRINQQICDTDRVSKNLLKMENQTETTSRDNQQNFASINYLIIHLKRKGLADITIDNYQNCLLNLVKHSANLSVPQTVTDILTLAQTKWGTGYKHNVIVAYEHYCDFYRLTWDKPQIKRKDTSDDWIPTKELVYKVIHALRLKRSVYMQLIAETGMRRKEALDVEWNDVDFKHYRIHVKTIKNGKNRTLTVENMRGILTKEVFHRMKQLPKISKKIFGDYKDVNDVTSGWAQIRPRVAFRLNEPDVNKLKIKTLRAYVGTKLYSIYRCQHTVKYLLGHKSTNSTDKYIKWSELFFENPKNFVVKIAYTSDELGKYLANGFEYVCDFEGKPVLRIAKGEYEE